MTPTTLNLLRTSFTRSVGYGRMVRNRTRPTFRPCIAHMLNRETRRHGVAALHEKHDVGAIGHELFDPRIVSPPKNLRELVVNLLDYRHRIFHRAGTLQLKRRPLLGHDLRAVRDWMAWIERIRMLVGRQEFLHLPRIRQFDVTL